MRPKLVLHLGPHKTGSTFLQKSLHNQWLSNKSFGYSSVHSEHKKRHKQLRQKINFVRNAVLIGRFRDGATISKSAEFARAKEHLTAMVQEDAKNTFILSDENFLGVPMGQHMPGGDYFEKSFYPMSSKIATYFADITDQFETTIIIYKRNKRDLVESLYSNTIKNLSFTGNIKEYCQLCDLNSINFSELRTSLGKAFGASSVRLLDYAKLSSDRKDFLKDFYMASGIKIDESSCPSKRINTRLCDRHIEKAKLLAKGRWDQALIKEFQEYIKREPATDNDTYASTTLS